jgi:hypothetical protein
MLHLVEKDLKNFSKYIIEEILLKKKNSFFLFSYLDIAEGKRIPHKGQTSPKVIFIYKLLMKYFFSSASTCSTS